MGISQVRCKQVTLLWTFNSLLPCASSPLLTFVARVIVPRVKTVPDKPAYASQHPPSNGCLLFWLSPPYVNFWPHINGTFVCVLCVCIPFLNVVFLRLMHAVVHIHRSFLSLLSSIPWHGCTTFMDIWVVFHLGLLWIKPLWFRTKAPLIGNGRKLSYNRWTGAMGYLLREKVNLYL